MAAEPKTFSNHRSTRPAEDLLQGIEVIDDHFHELIDTEAQIQKHWTGCEWAEGPAYFPEGDYV